MSCDELLSLADLGKARPRVQKFWALLLILVGVSGATWLTWLATTRPRPLDLLAALLAPIALLAALLGGVWLLVPTFL